MSSDVVRRVFVSIYAKHVLKKIKVLSIRCCIHCINSGDQVDGCPTVPHMASFIPVPHFWCSLASHKDKVEEFMVPAFASVDQTDIIIEWLNNVRNDIGNLAVCCTLQDLMHQLMERGQLYKDIEKAVEEDIF